MERTHINVCPHDCWDTCSLKVTVNEEGKAVKIKGNEEHPITKGFLCIKVNHYLERVYHPKRLLYPMRRVGKKGEAKFERISWDEAVAIVTEQFKKTIREYGAEAILPYSYAGNMGVINYGSMDRRFFGKMGAARLDRTICSAAGEVALNATFGKRVGVDPEDMVYSKLILIWGINPMTTNIHQVPILEEARRRGAKIVVIDPYKHEMARRADLFLQIKPGTDSALALGLMHLLIRENRIDRPYIDRFVYGYEELEERAKAYPPERVAQITGLPIEKIVELARMYGEIKPSVIRVGYGIQRHTNGGEMIRSIALLPALIGAWQEVGGGLLLSNSQAFPINKERLVRPEIHQGNPRTINMVQLATALEDAVNPIKMMYVYNSNPADVAPDTNRVIKGLMREDLFLVVHEQMMTETCKYADILLPATTVLEHLDLHTSYWHLYIQLNEPAIPPLGEAKPNTETFRLLAKGMGYTEECFQDSDEELIRQALDTDHPFMKGITYEALKEKKFMKIHFPGHHFMPFQEGFPTTSGKVEAKSETLAQLGLHAVPDYTPLKESEEGSPTLYEKYPIHFLTPAAKHFLNSTFNNVEKLRKWEKEPTVFLHPEDARERGISDGDPVRVFNDRGSILLTAKVGDQVGKGVALSPSIWSEQNVNRTTSEEVSDMGGGSSFHTNLVQIEKIRR
ncbi:putative oxidoreductase yoaE [[Clostridium] ultunense Esp]|uniref:molybdopterin-containing oxidoreductase family protein n=1 Tax=Thermicanus aegyptius TaxID=94009 RepID=UPI0002B70DDE|nr:molybdopterin oxidoreductase family protein [Thermicanus aegyptius]CCQ95054.1 putative oxidoreductase yoaE [[Clostridium] ultunense Esp]